MALLRRCVINTVRQSVRRFNDEGVSNRPKPKGVNQVTLCGNIGQDPETFGTEDRPITVLNLATNESRKNNTTGEWMNRTDWHRIMIPFKGAAEWASNNLRKGDRVLVTGKLQYRVNTTTDEETGRPMSTKQANIIADNVISMQQWSRDRLDNAREFQDRNIYSGIGNRGGSDDVQEDRDY